MGKYGRWFTALLISTAIVKLAGWAFYSHNYASLRPVCITAFHKAEDPVCNVLAAAHVVVNDGESILDSAHRCDVSARLECTSLDGATRLRRSELRSIGSPVLQVAGRQLPIAVDETLLPLQPASACVTPTAYETFRLGVVGMSQEQLIALSSTILEDGQRSDCAVEAWPLSEGSARSSVSLAGDMISRCGRLSAPPPLFQRSSNASVLHCWLDAVLLTQEPTLAQEHQVWRWLAASVPVVLPASPAGAALYANAPASLRSLLLTVDAPPLSASLAAAVAEQVSRLRKSLALADATRAAAQLLAGRQAQMVLGSWHLQLVASAQGVALGTSGAQGSSGVLQLSGDADAGGNAATAGPPLMQPVAQPARESLSQASGTAAVAFAVNELSPFTGGGAGVVASALIPSVLAAGINVVVIADLGPEVPCANVQAWAAALPAAAGAHARVHCVADLLGAAAALRTDRLPLSRHLAASVRWALAAVAAHSLTPFAAIEFFDFFAPAYALLYARHAQQAVPYLAPAGCAGQPLDAARWTLPRDVSIVVRHHATMEEIEQAEGQAAVAEEEADGKAAGAGKEGAGEVPWPRELALLFAMERFAMAAADVVLEQSRSGMRYLRRAYRRYPTEAGSSSSIVYAPPPMSASLEALLAGSEQLAPATADRLAHLLPGATPGGSSATPPLFLVFGKLQPIKGVTIIARAIERLCAAASASEAPRAAVPRFLFVGRDLPHPSSGEMMSRILHRACMPCDCITVLPALPRAQLPALVKLLQPRAAIIASLFESYNMVAHEMTALRLPLVLADLYPFRDFWGPGDAFFFEPGDASSLQQALERATSHHRAVAERVAQRPEIDYADASTAYRELIGSLHEQHRTSIKNDGAHLALHLANLQLLGGGLGMLPCE